MTERTNRRKMLVFICHASEDHREVEDLTRRLKKDGIDVWVDEEDLLPGQDWELKIRKAVEEADAVIVCLSCLSVKKEGYFQKEMHFIFGIASQKPEGAVFVIPVRLDECETPTQVKPLQWANYFPDTEKNGVYRRIFASLQERAAAIGVHLPSRKGTFDRRPGTKVPIILVAILLALALIGNITWWLMGGSAAFAMKSTAIPSTEPPSVLVTPSVTKAIAPTLSPSPISLFSASLSPTLSPSSSSSPTSTLMPGNCILSDEWMPYLSGVAMEDSKDDPCLNLADWGITREAEHFTFFWAGARRTQWYGISTDIPDSATVQMNLVYGQVRNSEFWIGFSSGPEPTTSGTFFIVKPNNEFIVRTISDSHYIDAAANIPQGDSYQISLELQGNRMAPVIFIVKHGTSKWTSLPIQIPGSNRRLYMGMQLFVNGSIDVEISNLEIH